MSLRSTFQLISTGTLAALIVAVMTLSGGAVQAGEVIASGQFEGRSNHVTTGTVTIKQEGGKTLVILEDNFSLDGAPDPTLAFAKNGKFNASTEFSELKSKTGRQVYELPANVDAKSHNEFLIWCRKYSVPLGSAKLH